jgi:Mitochondrial ribosomal protein mL59
MNLERAKKLVALLPTKLANFFVKYPPRNPSLKPIYSKTDPSIRIAKHLHDFQPVPPELYTTTVSDDPVHKVKRIFYSFQNPFEPSRDLRTGRFIGPRYSLRRQADIIKLAIRYGVHEMLPPSDKMDKILTRKSKPMIGTLRPKGTYEQRTRKIYVAKKEKAVEKAMWRMAKFKTVPSPVSCTNL